MGAGGDGNSHIATVDVVGGPWYVTGSPHLRRPFWLYLPLRIPARYPFHGVPRRLVPLFYLLPFPAMLVRTLPDYADIVVCLFTSPDDVGITVPDGDW